MLYSIPRQYGYSHPSANITRFLCQPKNCVMRNSCYCDIRWTCQNYFSQSFLIVIVNFAQCSGFGFQISLNKLQFLSNLIALTFEFYTMQVYTIWDKIFATATFFRQPQKTVLYSESGLWETALDKGWLCPMWIYFKIM